MKTRASKGGEIGINGEAYEGGQFLPSSPDTIKGAMGNAEAKKAKAYMSRKQEIARYKWETPPSPNHRAIYPTLAFCARFEKDGYSKETGVTGKFSFMEDIDFYEAGWTDEGIKEAKDLVEKWNQGERWTERG